MEEKEQIPIFIPLDEILSFPDPMEMPDNAGRLELKAKNEKLHGYRCTNITSVCHWNSNGAYKGFARTLVCHYNGSMANFNFMLRAMNNVLDEHNYIVLLQRDGGPYVVFGNSFKDITLGSNRVDNQTFELECAYHLVPFPYYDGPVEVTDCTSPELMGHLYGVKLEM